MFPIKDLNPARTVPYTNFLIIMICVVVYFWESRQGKLLEAHIYRLSVIPVLYTESWGLTTISNKIFRMCNSMFLHGGLGHLLGNMWFLWIFGDNVEDRMGHFRYLLFYLFGGLAAAILHIMLFPDSTVPIVGASGAIAAVMGAYLFFFPEATILAFFPNYYKPFFHIPAFIYLIFWFLYQLVKGMLDFESSMSGVAFWAHIGGFVFGLILAAPLGGKVRKRWKKNAFAD